MMPSTDGAKAPVQVAVTGAAGQIGYSLLFRIAAGDMLGDQQPIVLRLLEIEPAMKALEGVAMELDDCAFPLLHDIVLTSKAEKAFDGASWCLLVGAVPRKQGMERSDLLNGRQWFGWVDGVSELVLAHRRTKVEIAEPREDADRSPEVSTQLFEPVHERSVGADRARVRGGELLEREVL